MLDASMLPTLERVLRNEQKKGHLIPLAHVARVQGYFTHPNEDYRQLCEVYAMLGVPSDWIAGDDARKNEFANRVHMAPDQAIRLLLNVRKKKRLPTEVESGWIRRVVRASRLGQLLADLDRTEWMVQP